MNPTWDSLTATAVDLRHHLHRNPELRWEEEQTARTVRERLDRASIAWRPCAGTGTVATLAPGAPGRHLAFRADIDALPIAEASVTTWKSLNSGVMHACGHDGHTASLMMLAWWLKEHEGSLEGPVSLLFQPAEEGGHGAKKMVEEGALEGVDAIYGWHNWPALPFGKAACPDGPVMAANGTFAIRLTGVGGHASQPELCRDPVLAASAVTMALQQVVSRRLAPQHATVLSVTSIEAPSGETIIPGTATLKGSYRLPDSSLRPAMDDLIATTAARAADTYGVSADVEVRPRYEATVNHPEEAARMRTALQAELGPDWQDGRILLPVMASEDFSYYLAEKPGAFALIGGADGDEPAHPLHSPHYDFNDRLIPRIARIFSRLAGVPAGV